MAASAGHSNHRSRPATAASEIVDEAGAASISDFIASTLGGTERKNEEVSVCDSILSPVAHCNFQGVLANIGPSSSPDVVSVTSSAQGSTICSTSDWAPVRRRVREGRTSRSSLTPDNPVVPLTKEMQAVGSKASINHPVPAVFPQTPVRRRISAERRARSAAVADRPPTSSMEILDPLDNRPRATSVQAAGRLDFAKQNVAAFDCSDTHSHNLTESHRRVSHRPYSAPDGGS